MYRLIVSVLGVMLATGSFAAHHEEPEPMVAEVYECSLNNGATADDVAALGAGEFADFVAEYDISMTSFLWEAVAVSPQYGDADVRWVNYFPTWADYFAGDAAWREHGSEVAAKINELVSCGRPDLAGFMQAGEAAPDAPVKPLYVRVCQLKPGNTMANAMAYRRAVNSIQNKQIGSTVGSYLFTPGFGNPGFDYGAMVTGTPEDMAKLMDHSRDGSTGKLLTSAGYTEPGNCTVDLHRSLMMVSQ
jgi:hypothetical protein